MSVKRSERCKHYTLAVARQSLTFCPAADPLPRAQDGRNLISWRCSLPLPTNPVWWGSMHAISSHHGNRPTHKQTDRQDWLQYTAPHLACNVNLTFIKYRVTQLHGMCRVAVEEVRLQQVIWCCRLLLSAGLRRLSSTDFPTVGPATEKVRWLRALTLWPGTVTRCWLAEHRWHWLRLAMLWPRLTWSNPMSLCTVIIERNQSDSYFLQCSDIVGWATGRASGP